MLLVRGRGRTWIAVGALTGALLSLVGAPVQAGAQAAPADGRNAPASPVSPAGQDLAKADPRWWRGGDFLITGRGDSGGYHLHVGWEKERYVLRPLATIQPNGHDGDDWLGYQCVTGDRRHVVVNLLPRGAVNRAELRDRGGLVYVVDLPGGRVRPVVKGIAFKYHAVGCGTGSTAAVLRHLGTDQERSEVLSLDARTGKVGKVATVPGQLVSPVPAAGGPLALQGRVIVRVRAGARAAERVAGTPGEPFRLTAAPGGADLLVSSGRTVTLQSLRGSALRRVGEGPAGQVRLFPGADGHNVAVGLSGAAQATAPASASRIAARPRWPVPQAGAATSAPQPNAASVEGKVVLATVDRSPLPKSPTDHGEKHGKNRDETKDEGKDGDKSGDHGAGGADEEGPYRSERRMFAAATGELLATRSDTEATARPVTAVPTTVGGTAAPVRTQRAAGSLTPVCGVPRNEPRRQAYSATHDQVNWAVEMASRNRLNGANARPANYLASGLAAYSPSSDFALPALRPNGGNVPPAVMNGVLAQESAYRQASRRTLPGSGGNSVISDYYGAGGTLDVIDYNKADCGYGIAQVTTGMRIGEPSISPNGKAKVAMDYAENIQAGMNILAGKWNQLYDANIRMNNNDPAAVENWYFALWAYNSGVNPQASTGNTTGCTPGPSCTDNRGNWGLGWTNNPMNPDYPPERDVFLRQTYADAEHPGDWPYQERILGWAETPIRNYKGHAAYPPARPGDSQPGGAVRYPNRTLFCNDSNNCSPDHDPSGTDFDFCRYTDWHCWWHQPVSYLECPLGECARSDFTYETDATEPEGSNPWAPACNSDLGSRAIIVDELPDPAANIFCPNRNWTSAGTFTYETGRDSGGAPLGEIDFHQVATGHGAHAWFSGNKLPLDQAHRVTGTWTIGTLPRGPYVVKAHIPTAGASTSSAVYKITTASGEIRERVINQHEHFNHWKSLGLYELSSNARVALTNVTRDDTEPDKGTVAWDALAFIPAPGIYREEVIDAVALFDEDQDLDTSSPTSWLDTPFAGMQELFDWGHRLGTAAEAEPPCPADPAPDCVMRRTRLAVVEWLFQVIRAGTDPVNHPDGESIADWVGFANPYTYRPLSDRKPAHFDNDDSSYKIKSRVTISYSLGSDGKIVPGSQDASYEHRTGDTHLPRFVLEFMRAVAAEYDEPVPDMSYRIQDLHVHDHQFTSVNPGVTGTLPGRAYRPAGLKSTTVDDTCATGQYVSGGSIGYRPMLGVGHVSAAVDGWRNRLRENPDVNLNVIAVADEIYNAFFKDGQTGSVFNQAPPIWQEINLRACVDGDILPFTNAGLALPLLRYSHMPDQYFYHNGFAMKADGRPSGSSDPLSRGDFLRFSRIPDPPSGFSWANPWGQCNWTSDSTGNPWDITSVPPADPGTNPSTVHFCYDPFMPIDED